MGKMMRSLLASAEGSNHRKGRNSSPSVATAPDYVISSLPLGSTDGTGARLVGAITGIETQTQAQQIADWQGVLQYLAPKCYGIRGSFVVTNELLNSNVFSSAGPEAIIASTSILDPRGGNAASFLQETTATGPNWPRYDLGVGPVPQGQVNTASVDIAPAGRQWFFLLYSDTVSGGATIWFDMVNEVWGSESDVNNTLVEKKFEVLPNGYFRISLRYRSDITTGNGVISCGPTIVDGSTPTYQGDGSSGVYLFNMQHFRNTDVGIPNEVGPTTTTPVTVCYDHLPDGTPLRPFYSFAGTHRYDVFRPSSQARNMVFNVGDCIEAMATDNIWYYYEAATAGTTGATSPDFAPLGDGGTTDGGVIWNPVGYATLKGLELAPVGDLRHPEGVVAQLDVANVLSDSQIFACDYFPDVAETKAVIQTDPTCKLSWSIFQMKWLVGTQTRTGNAGQPLSAFQRCLTRMNTVNSILYNLGAMFTGATGGPITPTGVFLGEATAAGQATGCILNFVVLKNAGLNDTNAIARSRYDLKPSVGLNDAGVFLTSV